MRGCGNLDVGECLPFRSAGFPALWRRNLGCDPMHRADVGEVPPQGGAEYLGQTTHNSRRKDLGVPPVGGSYAVSKVVIDGDLHLKAPEYGHAIHCDNTYSGPIPGGGAEARIMDYKEAVGSGGSGISRPMGGG